MGTKRLTELPKCAIVNHCGASALGTGVAFRRLTLGVLAGTVALSVAGIAPASAEFFGCKEPHTKVTYSPDYYPKRHNSWSDARDYRNSYAAPRPRHTIYSSRRAEHYRPNWWR